MRYFPIADPISDLRLVALDRNRCELSIYIDGQPRGLIRLYFRELASVLDLFASPRPIADLNIFEEATQWHGEYKKNHVVGDDGALHHVGDLP